MCGITGFLDLRREAGAQRLEATARAMAAAMPHRGPDDDGVWCDPAAGLALGFRRLAIIDLSQAGHQPMVSRTGGGAIVFNGEIYNAEAMRPELAARARPSPAIPTQRSSSPRPRPSASRRR